MSDRVLNKPLLMRPPEVFCKKRCCLKFSKICRKTPVPETLVQVFSCKFCEISNNTFITENLWTTPSASWSIQEIACSGINFWKVYRLQVKEDLGISRVLEAFFQFTFGGFLWIEILSVCISTSKSYFDISKTYFSVIDLFGSCKLYETIHGLIHIFRIKISRKKCNIYSTKYWLGGLAPTAMSLNKGVNFLRFMSLFQQNIINAKPDIRKIVFSHQQNSVWVS